MVAKQSRTLVVGEQAADTVNHTIVAPADETVTVSGASINIMDGVKVVTVTTKADQTQSVSETTDGIQYTVTYQPDAVTPETEIQLDGSTVLSLQSNGIYKITYRYTDTLGNMAEYVRTVIVTILA